MKIFNKKHSKEPPARYSENSQGDFSVENDACIFCGAPKFEAPELIDHSKAEYEHCYFKKQPETPDELERAICAMQVSCVASLRYGGTDEKILKRLYEERLENVCDHKPKGRFGFFKKFLK